MTKKLFFLILFLFGFYIAIAQQTPYDHFSFKKPPECSFDKMIMKFDIKRCVIYDSALYPDGFKRVLDSTQYNKNGQVIEHFSFISSKQIDKKQTFTYDDDGHMTSMLRYQSAFKSPPANRKNKNGESIEVFGIDQEESTYKETYTYNADKKLASSTYHDPSGSSSTTYFQYDKEGKTKYIFNEDHSLRNYIRFVKENDVLKKQHVFNSKDSLIGGCEWVYDNNSQLIEYSTDGLLEYSAPYSAKFKYDTQGNTIELEFDDEKNKLFSLWKFVYDQHGHLLQETIYDSEKLFIYKETYVYDSYDLLIKKYIYNDIQQPMRVEFYHYEFYK